MVLPIMFFSLSQSRPVLGYRSAKTNVSQNGLGAFPFLPFHPDIFPLKRLIIEHLSFLPPRVNVSLSSRPAYRCY